MDWDRINSETDQVRDWLNSMAGKVVESAPLGHKIVDLFSALQPPGKPDLTGVETLEDLKKWSSNPENKKTYDEWLFGMIPGESAMLKAQGLEQWAKKGYELAKNMPAQEKMGFLDKLQSTYSSLKERISQGTFDKIQAISPEKAVPGSLAKGTYSLGGKAINVDLSGSDTPDILNTLFHEFTHAEQYGTESQAMGELFGYTNRARQQALKYVEAAPGSIPYDMLEKSIYQRHDPTEAMARYVGKEMSETSSQFDEVANAYLDSFSKGHKDYAALPADKKGFDLGPDFEKFFRSIYEDRTAGRILKQMEEMNK